MEAPTLPKLSALQRLRKQREKLDSRIDLAEARLKVSERKKDTRRKILVGSYFLEQAKNENKIDEINKIMAGFLTRESDKKLFGLPAESEKEAAWVE